MSTTDARPTVLDAVVWISVLLAAGSLLMAIAHAGVRIPLFSALGPAGNRAVPPAAIAFSVGALLHGLVAYGVAGRRTWAWPVGVTVAAVTLIGAATPFRGAGSLVGIVLAAAQLGLLLTGTARRAILRSATA